MVLNIHSNASYLSEPKAQSTARGHFFLGSQPQDNKPILLNGAIHTLCQVIKHVAASATEAELGGVFLNAQQGLCIQRTLKEMGHPQPKTPLHCDNSTAIGIANKSIKKQCSCSMNMRYFWILDQIQQGNFDVIWRPGQENLGDYPTKHHTAAHHQHVRPYYVHTDKSPRYLLRALDPHLLQGCVDSTLGPYNRQTPLPRNKTRSVCHQSTYITHYA